MFKNPYKAKEGTKIQGTLSNSNKHANASCKETTHYISLKSNKTLIMQTWYVQIAIKSSLHYKSEMLLKFFIPVKIFSPASCLLKNRLVIWKLSKLYTIPKQQKLIL